MGMVGTITASVLGLLISSAKTYYDNQRDELAQMSANVVMLGRLLRHYGPEANVAHEILRLTVGQFLVTTWPEEGREKVDVLPPTAKTESLLEHMPLRSAERPVELPHVDYGCRLSGFLRALRGFTFPQRLPELG